MKAFFGLFFAATVATSSANLCVPGLVPNITLHPNYTLTWQEAHNVEECHITNYVINIFNRESGIELQFETNSSTFQFDGSFLSMCTTYTFEVHALTSKAVLGPSVSYAATTSPEKGMNLALKQVNVTTKQGEIILDWALAAPKTQKCVSYYRVVYWDERNAPKDVYVTSTKFDLKKDIPCAKYSFQVNAIVGNPDLQGPISEVVTEGAGQVPRVPILVSLFATNNSANMVWELEPYSQNHCSLSKLNVYTLGVASGSANRTQYIDDNINRPNVHVTIDNLSPNEVYVSYVNVQNNIGASPNVTVTYQITDTFGHIQYSME